MSNTTGTELEIIKKLEKAYFNNNPTQKARNTKESMEWFRKFITKNYKNVRLPRLLSDSTIISNKLIPGNMALFQYDPKWKEKLPIYDTLPIIIPCGAYTSSDGMTIIMGINFHYLQPSLRAKALQAILTLKSSKKLSWSQLKQMSESKLFEHALHSYRLDHIKSKFVLIPEESYEIAVFLPTARFHKGNNSKAWGMK